MALDAEGGGEGFEGWLGGDDDGDGVGFAGGGVDADVCYDGCGAVD